MTDEELGSITSIQLKRWYYFKCYGVADLESNDRPTEGRSWSMKFYKKTISYYQPNWFIAWNTLQGEENSAKVTQINNLIIKSKKVEVRKEGAVAKARRAIKKHEFEQILEIANNR